MTSDELIERLRPKPKRWTLQGRKSVPGRWGFDLYEDRHRIRFFHADGLVMDPLALTVFVVYGFVTKPTQLFTAGKLLGLRAWDVQNLYGATNMFFMWGRELIMTRLRMQMLAQIKLKEPNDGPHA